MPGPMSGQPAYDRATRGVVCPGAYNRPIPCLQEVHRCDKEEDAMAALAYKAAHGWGLLHSLLADVVGHITLQPVVSTSILTGCWDVHRFPCHRIDQ